MRIEDEEIFWSKFGIDISENSYEKSDKTLELDSIAENIIELLKGENLEDVDYVLETVSKLSRQRATI